MDLVTSHAESENGYNLNCVPVCVYWPYIYVCECVNVCMYVCVYVCVCILCKRRYTEVVRK